MRRRLRRGPVIVAGLVLGVTLGAALSSGQLGERARAAGTPIVHAPRHPNIVLILTDDQRRDTLWTMPNVRRLLVAHGILFTNAFVSNPFCCPSRATILTGNYSHTTGIYGNRPPHGGAYDFHHYGDDQSTIATWLQAAGYRTALVGKYLNGYHGPHVPPGWDTWDSFNWGYGYYGFRLFQNGHPAACGGAAACQVTYPAGAYSTSTLASLATGIIRSTPREQPLFLYFAPFAPHTPAIPEHRYADRFGDLPPWRPPNFNWVTASQPHWLRTMPHLRDRGIRWVARFRRRQYQTLLSVDDAVKQLVDALEATGRLHNTMIMFASDNGLMWGAHGFPAAVKRLPYDEAIRIPMVVRYPPWTDAGPRVDKHLILNTDWAPTWAGLAHAAAPATEGRSFVPLLRPGHGRVPWRTSFLLEGWDGSPTTANPSYCGVRSNRFMYAEYQDGERELYDVARDPFELRDLAASARWKRVRRTLDRITRRLCSPGPPGFEPNW